MSIRRPSKRDRSGDKYRYKPKETAVPPIPDKDTHRDELKHLLGKKILASGVLFYNSEGPYCKINNVTVTFNNETLHLKYVWTKARKFLMGNIEDKTTVTFTAVVRIYNSDSKIKYGLTVLKLQE